MSVATIWPLLLIAVASQPWPLGSGKVRDGAVAVQLGVHGTESHQPTTWPTSLIPFALLYGTEESGASAPRLVIFLGRPGRGESARPRPARIL